MKRTHALNQRSKKTKPTPTPSSPRRSPTQKSTPTPYFGKISSDLDIVKNNFKYFFLLISLNNKFFYCFGKPRVTCPNRFFKPNRTTHTQKKNVLLQF